MDFEVLCVDAISLSLVNDATFIQDVIPVFEKDNLLMILVRSVVCLDHHLILLYGAPIADNFVSETIHRIRLLLLKERLTIKLVAIWLAVQRLADHLRLLLGHNPTIYHWIV